MLTFNEENHEYRWFDKIVPSTTQIIREWILVDDMYVNRFHPEKRIAKSAMQSGGDRGTGVHKAIDIILTSDLDWDALDPSLVPPLREFQRWQRETKAEFVGLGEPMYSEKYGYAGTPDPWFRIKTPFKWVLFCVDLKTGGHDLVGPQTAAYEQLYREKHNYKGVMLRACLYLPAEGPYKFIPLTNRNDWRFFQSCLDQRNYLNAR